MNAPEPSRELHSFYLSRFSEYGISAQGVGWGPKDNQFARFENLTGYWNLKDKRVLDVGAGTADLFAWLEPREIKSYVGLELMEFYCDAAKQRFTSPKFEIRKHDIFASLDYPDADLGFVSGTFNIIVDGDQEARYQSIYQVFHRLLGACTEGFAANFLSDDTTFRDPSLFYANSERILEIARNFSRRVVLSHVDFPFEFTVYVWVDDRFNSATSRYENSIDT